jgi:mRNA-degrading endonuclease toxin of MazEF toxin-antitoxin module
MRRGEVWWATPRMAGGSRKQRPVLVISSDVFNENRRYPKVVVVHLTSQVHPGAPFLWEVEVPRGGAGLKQMSIAKCAEPYTLLKEMLTQQVGQLSARLMADVDAALGRSLSLRLEE